MQLSEDLKFSKTSTRDLLSANLLAVQGMVIFDLRSMNGALVTTTGVSGLEAGNGFRIPVDNTINGIAGNTGIAMANVNPSNRMTVVLVLLAESGSGSSSVTGNPRFITLGPGHQIVDFVTNIWPQLPAGFRGTLAVSVVDYPPPNSLVVTALSLRDGLLTALPAIPQNSCFGCWDY